MEPSRRFSAFVASDRDPRSTIVEALQFARDFLSRSCLDERACVKASIVIEELVSNCLRHGGADRDISLWLALNFVGDGLAIEVEDDGPAFDPTATIEFTGPDRETGGGIGLVILRTWGEDLSYQRSSERNVVRLKIR